MYSTLRTSGTGTQLIVISSSLNQRELPLYSGLHDDDEEIGIIGLRLATNSKI
jgi:hypothetical protein